MSRQPGGGRETAWWQKPEKEGHSGRVDLVPSPPLLRVSRGRNLNPLKINEIAKCQIIFKEQQKEREVGRVFEEEGDNQHATRDRKTSKTSYGMYRQHQIKRHLFSAVGRHHYSACYFKAYKQLLSSSKHSIASQSGPHFIDNITGSGINQSI